jgi:chromosome segregation ATPase
MQDVTYGMINKFVTEIGEMQNRLSELDKIKVELEEELGLEEQLTNSNAEKRFLSDNLEHEIKERKCVEEEFHAVKASLEEQLTNSNAEKNLLSANLEHEINERKRVEKESRVVKASLEEQLTKRESEMDVLMNNLKSERQSFDQALGNLQQQFDTWLNRIFEGRK